MFLILENQNALLNVADIMKNPITNGINGHSLDAAPTTGRVPTDNQVEATTKIIVDSPRSRTSTPPPSKTRVNKLHNFFFDYVIDTPLF